MATGKVKWFNNAKGYGFILADSSEDGSVEGGGTDLFAHYSAIEMDGYKTLKAGQDVCFDITEGPKGLQATNIRGPEGQLATATDSELPQPESDIPEPRATSRVLSVTVEETPDRGGETDHLSPGKASRSN